MNGVGVVRMKVSASVFEKYFQSRDAQAHQEHAYAK